MNTPSARLETAMSDLPLMAILRGMGVERITQVKYQVNDLRVYSQNDIRFLKQFQSV